MKHRIEKIKQNKLLFVGGIGILVIAVATTFGFWLYSAPYTAIKTNIFNKTNLPAGKVGENFISSRELFERYNKSQQIYNKEQPSEVTIGDVFNRLSELSKLEQIARQKSVSVTQEEIDKEFARIENQEGGAEQFAKLLNDNFQFDSTYFKSKVIEPEILQTKLATWFYSNKELNQELYKTLTVVQERLDKGEDFVALAKTYSEDTATKQFGGDNGEVPIANLAPELVDSIKQAEIGETLTVPTRFGVYLIKIINKDDSKVEGGSVHFQSIMLNYGKINTKAEKSAFAVWYDNEANALPITKYLNLVN